MSDLGELDLSGITAAQGRQILDRLLREDFDQWPNRPPGWGTAPIRSD